MSIHLITEEKIAEFFSHVAEAFNRPATIYLQGETSLVVEGWKNFTGRIEFASSVMADDRSDFNDAVVSTALQLGLKVTDEFPGEVVPLPAGYEERHRPLTQADWADDLPFEISHFDPYSISFRFIARGSEPDYHVVLSYLEHGWATKTEMIERLEALLTEFSFETIQQDPAEFRRRMGGLWQMWKARQQRLEAAGAAG